MITLTPAEQAHRALLESWRAAMDLIGPGDAMAHFIDCAQAVDGLPATGRWADLGRGAGFPGVALAARHPDTQVLLVESRRKRAIFLDQVLSAAKLPNATVFRGRVESLDDRSVDGVISRAYKAPDAFLVDATRLVRPSGYAVVMLGGGARLDAPLGWTLCDVRRYPVADGDRQRALLQRDD
ncbi:MAG: RsmG family class I SAM-dependent methyltransferase [Myxococcota bacterium]